MDKRIKTKFTGVYKLVSEVRRHDGKPDVCFYIYYRQDGKLVKEKVGWTSEGYSAAVAAELRSSRVMATRHGEPFVHKHKGAECLSYGEAWEVFAEKWLPTLSRPEEEKSRYRLYIEQKFACRRLDRISVLDLENFKQELLAKGLAASTVRSVLGDMGRVYRKMTSWGLYSGPVPLDGIQLPKPDNARQRYLTAEDAQKLMDALKKRSLNWWAIAMISLHTGMRLGEVLALKGSDLDFAAGVIHVLDAKSGTRMAHMTDTIKPVLKKLVGKDLGEHLFTTSSGKPMKVTDTSKTFARTVADLGFNAGITDNRQKVVFHTLRHTFCSWLAISGEALYTIGELVGHSSIEMTRRYSHLCPDTKKAAIKKIDHMASGANQKTNTAPQRRKRVSAAAPRRNGPISSARSRRTRRP